MLKAIFGVERATGIHEVTESNSRIQIKTERLSKNIAIEIAEYLPDAHPDALGSFKSRSDDPKNPLLELRVHLPKESKPRRQIVLAKSPLTNLDAIYGPLPVRFRYYHPQATPPAGLELLQDENSKLYGRIITSGTYEVKGEVDTKSPIELPGGFQLSLVEYWPHALRQIRFEPTFASSKDLLIDSAALVEVRTAQTTERAWVRRNDPLYGLRIIETPRGSMSLQYGNETMPLGFQLELVDEAVRLSDEHVAGAPAVVRLIDPARGIDVQRRISPNQPLVYAGFHISAPNDNDASHSIAPRSLHVVYVPGQSLKWCGAILMCAGLVIMLAYYCCVPASSISVDASWQR